MSVIQALAAPEPEVRERAQAILSETYWQPVYTYLRLKWRAAPADAEDMTQEFFSRALQRDFFAQYDPARARFRTWLRVGIDRMMANVREAAGRFKRGGGTVTVPLDVVELERQVAVRAGGPLPDDDELFRREVARSLFTFAVEALKEETTRNGKLVPFRLFVEYDLEGPDRDPRPTYAELAATHGVPVTQVTNHLAAMRRRFRLLVLERLRSMAGSENEFRAEARDLLGIDP
jgi:RNA polymerase sigma-70 factor (ECF subfamily)